MPAHVLLAHVWANAPLEDTDRFGDLLREYSNIDPAVAESHKHDITAFAACEAWLQNDTTRAKKLAEEVLVADPTPHEQSTTTAKLILARVVAGEGDTTRAKNLLEEISAPGHYMHQVRTIAERELADLGN